MAASSSTAPGRCDRHAYPCGGVDTATSCRPDRVNRNLAKGELRQFLDEVQAVGRYGDVQAAVNAFVAARIHTERRQTAGWPDPDATSAEHPGVSRQLPADLRVEFTIREGHADAAGSVGARCSILRALRPTRSTLGIGRCRTSHHPAHPVKYNQIAATQMIAPTVETLSFRFQAGSLWSVGRCSWTS